jgi:hypothetical protein
MGTTQLRLLSLLIVSVMLVLLSVIAPLPGVLQSSAAPAAGFTSTPSPTVAPSKTFTPAPPTSTATAAPPTVTATASGPTSTFTTVPPSATKTSAPATAAPQQATAVPVQPSATPTPVPATSSLPRTGLGLLGLAMGGGLVVVVATARRARTKA